MVTFRSSSSESESVEEVVVDFWVMIVIVSTTRRRAVNIREDSRSTPQSEALYPPEMDLRGGMG